MGLFHAGAIMATIVRDLQENGVDGLGIDGYFHADDPECSRALYALAELDVVEPEELPEYAHDGMEIGLAKAMRRTFDAAHRAFNAGRRRPTFWVTGDGYPPLPTGSRVLHWSTTWRWSFSMEFYAVTEAMVVSRRAAKRDLPSPPARNLRSSWRNDRSCVRWRREPYLHHHPTCGKIVPVSLLACRGHWYALRPGLRAPQSGASTAPGRRSTRNRRSATWRSSNWPARNGAFQP